MNTYETPTNHGIAALYCIVVPKQTLPQQQINHISFSSQAVEMKSEPVGRGEQALHAVGIANAHKGLLCKLLSIDSVRS